MTEFDPEKFEEKYVHYFEELETAYSNAYQQLHGQTDSEVLRAIDRQVLNESEPVYEGDGQFRVALPDDIEETIELAKERAHSSPGAGADLLSEEFGSVCDRTNEPARQVGEDTTRQSQCVRHQDEYESPSDVLR